jgi:hypothetical protein
MTVLEMFMHGRYDGVVLRLGLNYGFISCGNFGPNFKIHFKREACTFDFLTLKVRDRVRFNVKLAPDYGPEILRATSIYKREGTNGTT